MKRYVITDKGKAYQFADLADASLYCEMYLRHKGLCEIISKEDEAQFLAAYKDVLIEMYPLGDCISGSTVAFKRG